VKTFKATVSGQVQGVWFRDYTQKEAIKLGLKGFVKNRNDGTVYLEASGAEEALKSLAQWLNSGSPLSDVKNVEIEWGAPLRSVNNFEIKHS
jgi:acylphosphatase